MGWELPAYAGSSHGGPPGVGVFPSAQHKLSGVVADMSSEADEQLVVDLNELDDQVRELTRDQFPVGR